MYVYVYVYYIHFTSFHLRLAWYVRTQNAILSLSEIVCIHIKTIISIYSNSGCRETLWEWVDNFNEIFSIEQKMASPSSKIKPYGTSKSMHSCTNKYFKWKHLMENNLTQKKEEEERK